VSIPRGVLPAVSGGAGTGKSSLIQGCLPQAHPGMIIIGQNLAHGSRRPTTATYTGILDNVRKAFVKANKVDTALFSANTKGAAAPTGTGVVHRS
jgi:excinuclease UvrABC ATPase subunit